MENTQPMSDTRLIVEIKNTQPIELLDFSESMIALGNLYNRHMSRNPELTWDMDARLYVKEIRSGSIITELVDKLPLALPFIEYTNNIVDFAGHLKDLYYQMIGKESYQVEAQLGVASQSDTTDLRNAYRVLNPVVKDTGSQLNIGAVNFNGNVTVNLNLNSMEANAAQNALQRMIGSRKSSIQNHFEKQVFVWHVAKNDIRSQSGDKGYISTLSDRPVKVIFESESLKGRMLKIDENPMHKAFIVDVEVSYIEDKPIAYKVLQMHDYFDI